MLNGFKKVLILTLLTLTLVGAQAVAVYAQQSPAVITGRITDEAGNPVANAVVKVSVKCGECSLRAVEKHSAYTETDSSGNYEFEIPSDYLTEGYVEIDISVKAEGYGKAIQSVDLKPGQTLTANFVLEKGVVEEKEVAEEKEIVEEKGILALPEFVEPISVGLLSMIGVVMIRVTKLEKIIKSSLVDKLSRTVGVISFVIMAVVYLFLHGITGEIGPSTIFLTIIMSLLIGIVFALFVYSIKRCGIRGSKASSVGFVGIASAIAACVGCVLTVFIGVGAAIFLTQYGSVFTILAPALLLTSMIFMARNIKKEEECRICEPSAVCEDN